ncbi:TRAP transporter substrate-binding protein DctP [Thermodesulfobacteriota bacterium]
MFFGRCFHICVSLCLMCCALCFSGRECFSAGLKYPIKVATVAPETSTWVKHLKELDRKLRDRTEGRLGFRVYSGGIAGDELDVLKKIRIGQIHCAAFSGVGFGQILPMVRVLDLPFLFRNDREVDAVHSHLQEFFADAFRKKGLVLLAWAEVGNVHLFSKRPIRRIQDLAGLKVWAWSGDPIAKETFSAMGVNPIPLAITDVTTAINHGMVDTVYAPPLGALALQWHTSMQYMTQLPIVHSTGAVLISSRNFDRLPEDLSTLLQKSFRPAMEALTLDLRAQSNETVSLIQQSGITVLPKPQGADLDDFYSVHGRVARKLTGTIYPAELLERVYAVLEETRKSGQ